MINDFSFQEMLQYWGQFANKIKKEGKESLYSILTKNQPQLKENFVIRLAIDNNFQLEELNNCKSNLTLFLRQKLANDTISLVPDIIDKPQEKKLYTNKDKYQRLVGINPKLELLKQKLNLDID